MQQNFTNQDLEQMLNECVSELEALGYEVLPISKISFSRSNSKDLFGKCAYDYREFGYDEERNEYFGVPTVKISIAGNLSCLPAEEKQALKTIVMHETIHAVGKGSISEFLNRGLRGLITRHGDRYEEIKRNVEATYGYRGINNETADRLHPFMKEMYEQRKSRRDK